MLVYIRNCLSQLAAWSAWSVQFASLLPSLPTKHNVSIYWPITISSSVAHLPYSWPEPDLTTLASTLY